VAAEFYEGLALWLYKAAEMAVAAHPLLYALIARVSARGAVEPVYEAHDATPQVLLDVIKKLLAAVDYTRKQGRKSAIFDSRYLISSLVDGDALFVVACDGCADRQIAQSMQLLAEVDAQWAAQQHGKRVDWAKYLNTKIAEWSHEQQRNDRVKRLQDEVVDIKKIMKANLESLIQRQEAVDCPRQDRAAPD